MIIDTNDVYIYCDLFIEFKASTKLSRVYQNFVSIIKTTIIVNNNFDYFKRIDNGSHFCKSWYSKIIEKKILIFGFVNYINILFCQNYPDILNDLTSIEEVFITSAHPITSVLKLRPSETGSTTLNHRIWGYTVVLSQNLGHLLTILSLSNLASHNIIRITWASKRIHIFFEICLFIYVQRTRVLEAIYWLKINNPLYNNIVINFDLLYM